ncbi:hypothetical protein BGY98DRAFT_1100881 [Russula aff. rugulosa BPL654]|nr:hypothetical protein BGY98DRAFT_1100881 [Russula aff. rugulosa BPL654]
MRISLSSSSDSPIFNEAYPAQVRIKLKNLKKPTILERLKPKTNKPLISTTRRTPHSSTREQLIQELSTTLKKPLKSQRCPSDVAHTTDDDDSFSTRSSGWDEDTTKNTRHYGLHLRPHPHKETTCTLRKFRLADHTLDRAQRRRPYLSYSINRSKPEVSVVTVDQQRLLDPEAPFADAVNQHNHSLRPCAAVRQYQYYRETQYAIQASIKSLREKECDASLPMMETLEALPDPPSIRASATQPNSRALFAPLDAISASRRKEDKKDLDELEQTLRDPFTPAT